MHLIIIQFYHWMICKLIIKSPGYINYFLYNKVKDNGTYFVHLKYKSCLSQTHLLFIYIILISSSIIILFRLSRPLIIPFTRVRPGCPVKDEVSPSVLGDLVGLYYLVLETYSLVSLGHPRSVLVYPGPNVQWHSVYGS